MPNTKNEQSIIRDWWIYKITNPNNRLYIGVTSNIKDRISRYRYAGCKSQRILYNSIKKHGFDKHSVEIVDEFKSDSNYAYSKEMFWIKTYMSNAFLYPEQNGMNASSGGRGGIGTKLSEETKEKIRQANLGKKYSDEHKKRLSEIQRGRKGKKHTEETKNKIREAKIGFRHTDEAKKKISEASKGNSHNKGRKLTQEHIDALVKSNRGNSYCKGIKQSNDVIQKRLIKIKKPVVLYDLNNNFIKEFESITVASQELKISKWGIVNCVRGKIKKTRNYIFKYKKQCL